MIDATAVHQIADQIEADAERTMARHTNRRKGGRRGGRRALDAVILGWSTWQLAHWTGMSTDFMLEEIRAGELTASMFGAEYRIHWTEVRRYLDAKGWPRPAWMTDTADTADLAVLAG